MPNQNCRVQVLDRSRAVVSAETLGELHALIFKEPWSTGEIAELIEHSSCQGFVSYVDSEKPVGLALVRHAAGEGEILTFGVLPAFRRAGVGDALLTEILGWSIRADLETLYLEVCEDNLTAQLLYRKHGFHYSYSRKQYYRRRSGTSKDAVVLVRQLGVTDLNSTNC